MNVPPRKLDAGENQTNDWAGAPIPLPAALSASQMPHIPGYEVIRELGRGGMGVVYRARQVNLDRIVALKVVLHAEYAGSEMRARFRNEAHAVARFQHSNIVSIHEVGEANGLPYFSLEYCEGGTRADRLKNGPLESHEARNGWDAGAGSSAAHDQQVIHRDLKPANILLTADCAPKGGRLRPARASTRPGRLRAAP